MKQITSENIWPSIVQFALGQLRVHVFVPPPTTGCGSARCQWLVGGKARAQGSGQGCGNVAYHHHHEFRLIHLIYFHFVSLLLMNVCSIHSYVEF